MIFPQDGVQGLILEGIFNAGLPNEEFVTIRCKQDTNTANVGLMVVYNEPGLGYSTPLRDRMFWFGLAIMKPGSTIRVFTGTGKDVSFDSGNGLMNHHFFWGLPYTQFHDQRLIPALFRVSGAIVGRSYEPPRAPIASLQGPSASNLLTGFTTAG